jgi:CO/xanthine dehydrogenase Mo-binding subunit
MNVLSEASLATEYRFDGPVKVTGAAAYAADASRPGMLWAAYVRSPYPHAQILSIETSAARSAPGVHAVLTAADLPPTARFGRRLQDFPVLAGDRVRFVGDRVAVVAAETRVAAEAAASLIAVEYQELASILRAEDALVDGAPILHPEAADYTFLADRGPRRRPSHPNIQGYDVVVHGSDEARRIAFQNAAHIFEHTFFTPRLHQGYIEPHACLVWIDPDQTIRVISTNKSPFHLRDQFASAVGRDEHTVAVHSEFIGGDFGGKGLSLDEYICYFLASASGRPVKAVMSYVDELGAANPRHASSIRLRTAVDDAGHFLAHESVALIDGGAYAAGKPMPGLVVPAHMTLTPYHVPQARLEVTCVYTNLVPGGHNRAPGDVQATFAGESHVDEIARALGIDPIELRLRNIVRDGSPNVAGHAFHQPRGVEVLEALRRESHWNEPPSAGRGRGVAIGQRHVGTGKTSVVCQVLLDGRVEIATGAPEQGSGTYTAIQRLAAHALSVDPKYITVAHRDTPDAEEDGGIGGSRALNVYGNATLSGAAALKARLEELAAEVMGWPAGQVHLEDDLFRDDSGHTATFVEVTALIARGGPVTTTGSFASQTDEGVSAESFCGYVAEVEVDRETGGFTIRDVVFVGDLGTIINPVAHAGQLQGGFVYGLGSAVMEDLQIQDGQVTTLTLGDYKLPSVADTPPLRVVLLPTQQGPGPLGAKAAGELTNTTVAPAIANAIAAAGSRVYELPLTAERVLAGLEASPASRS